MNDLRLCAGSPTQYKLFNGTAIKTKQTKKPKNRQQEAKGSPHEDRVLFFEQTNYIEPPFCFKFNKNMGY